jgi:hypothetical protein
MVMLVIGYVDVGFVIEALPLSSLFSEVDFSHALVLCQDFKLRANPTTGRVSDISGFYCRGGLLLLFA